MFSINAFKNIVNSDDTGIKTMLNDASYAKKIGEVIEHSEEGLADLSFGFISLFSALSTLDGVGVSEVQDFVNPSTYATYDKYSDDFSDLRSDLAQAGSTSPVARTISGAQLTGTNYSLSDGLKTYDCFITTGGNIYLNGYLVVKFLYVMPDAYYALEVIQTSELVRLDSSKFSSDFSLRNLTNDVVTGYSTMMEYASILKDSAYAQFNASATSTSLGVTSVIDRVRNSKWLTDTDKNGLVAVAQGGAEGITSSIISWFSSFKDEAQQADTAGDSTFLSSTHVEISRYSKGAVLGLLEASFTVVSLVLMAASRVLGMIAAAVTAAVSIVGKIILSLATDYDESRFKIASDSDSTDNAYNFVINQGTGLMWKVAEWMRANNVTRASISLEPEEPVVTYVSLAYPDATPNDDPTRADIVNYECHLTPNHDIFSMDNRIALNSTFNTPFSSDVINVKYVTGLSDASATNIIKSMRWFGNRSNGGSAKTYCLIIHNDSEGGLMRYVALAHPQFWLQGNSSLLGHVAFPFVRLGRDDNAALMTPADLSKGSYYPMSIKLTNVINNFLGKTNMQDVLWRRLASALLLIIYRYIVYPAMYTTEALQAASNNYASFIGLDYHKDTSPYYNTISNGHFSETAPDFDRGMMSLLSPIADGQHSSLSDDCDSDEAPSINQLACDYILTKVIEPWFDGCVISRAFEYRRASSYWNTKVMHWNPNWTSTTDEDYLKLYKTAVSMNFTSASGNPQYNAYMFGPTLVKAGQVITWDDSTAVGFWPTKFAIELPTVTFSAFIVGLIADGFVVLAAAAVAVAAAVGFTKLKNKQARLQSQTEKAWYAYGEASYSGDAKQAEAAWKTYKRTRMKTNLLALVTGDGSMSLGLYNSNASGSTEGLLAKVTGFVNKEDKELTLNTLYKLISSEDFNN